MNFKVFFSGHLEVAGCSRSTFREGPEQRGVSDILLEVGIRAPLLQSLLLQDGNPADVTKQEPDEERGGHAQVLGAPHHRGGGEPEARPLQDLPQVVGVSAVGPESRLDEPPLEVEGTQTRFTALGSGEDPVWACWICLLTELFGSLLKIHFC